MQQPAVPTERVPLEQVRKDEIKKFRKSQLYGPRMKNYAEVTPVQKAIFQNDFSPATSTNRYQNHQKETKSFLFPDNRHRMRNELWKNVRASPTQKNKRKLRSFRYHQRIMALELMLKDKKKRRQFYRGKDRTRKLKENMRSGEELMDYHDSSPVYHRKGQPSRNLATNNYMLETRNMYECQDLKGNWYNCIVKAPNGDGSYICSVPLANGTTMNNCLVHGNKIRPHLIFNVEGLYEARDDEGIYWDCVVNDYLDKGHLRITVFGSDRTKYGELRAHWTQIQLALQLNLPGMYEAMDRQGSWWPVEIKKRLASGMFLFNCYLPDGVMIDGLKAYHKDFRLKMPSQRRNTGFSQKKLAKHDAKMNAKGGKSNQVIRGGPLKWGQVARLQQQSLQSKDNMMVSAFKRSLSNEQLPGQHSDHVWEFLDDQTWLEVLGARNVYRMNDFIAFTWDSPTSKNPADSGKSNGGKNGGKGKGKGHNKASSPSRARINR